jgi:hypothetical protein
MLYHTRKFLFFKLPNYTSTPLNFLLTNNLSQNIYINLKFSGKYLNKGTGSYEQFE